MNQPRKNFRFQRSKVSVPTAIVARWGKMGQQQQQILDSVLGVYDKRIEEWKRAERRPITEAIQTELESRPRTGESLMTMVERLTDRAVKERILSLLQFQEFRDWNNSPIHSHFARAVSFAAMDGDALFFKRLGRRLEKRPIVMERPPNPSPLSSLLLEHWISRKGLCLCWFSDKALVKLLANTKGSFSEDAVRKAHERLRLRKLRKPLLRDVSSEGDKLVCE